MVYDRGEFGWCGGGLKLDWMYLVGEFLSIFRKNWSGGNSLVVRNRLMLVVDGSGTVVTS